MKLELKPGFEWSRVRWDKPDNPVSGVCSYCDAVLDADKIPLRLWGETSGRAAQFCEACQRTWWGFR